MQRTIMEKRKVSHKELRKKALELILPYNPKFLASSFWISGFLHRHGLSLQALVHGMKGTKSRGIKRKFNKISRQHRQQRDCSNNQNGSTVSAMHEQENTCPSSEMQRYHEYYQQKIGKPRELLKQDISWKVCLNGRLYTMN